MCTGRGENVSSAFLPKPSRNSQLELAACAAYRAYHVTTIQRRNVDGRDVAAKLFRMAAVPGRFEKLPEEAQPQGLESSVKIK